MDVGGSKRFSMNAEVDITRKKNKQHGRRTARTEDSVEAGPGEYVRVNPITGVADDDVGSSVRLSSKHKGQGLELSSERQAVTGWKGYRSVRATHGFHQGTHYCEVTVLHLGETGHCRLGWSTNQSEINAPVGYDQFGFGYRDLEGSKVHKALRSEYGEPFGEGDVLGLFLHMPEGGKTLEARKNELVRHKGALYHEVPPGQDPAPLPGSVVAFTRNGVLQGEAFRDIPEGTYYPTVSLFTLQRQKEGAKVAFNFGPEFKFPPPVLEGCPAAAPMSDVPARQQAAAAAEEAAAMADPAAAAGSNPPAQQPDAPLAAAAAGREGTPGTAPAGQAAAADDADVAMDG